MENAALIAPIIALITWSLVMWVWMYVTRIPAIHTSKMALDPSAPRGEQMATLPATVRWKADNYNHLMEQPTLFYALVFSLILLEQTTSATIAFAWAYVALRILHSLVQTLGNKIEVRFSIFVLSNIPLFALTIMAACALI